MRPRKGPRTRPATCSSMAAEHYAFCPDNIDQGPGSIEDYAPGLVNLDRWDFWWD